MYALYIALAYPSLITSLPYFSLFSPAKINTFSETAKFWSSECREKVYFRYAESRQNSPKGQNLRVNFQHSLRFTVYGLRLNKNNNNP